MKTYIYILDSVLYLYDNIKFVKIGSSNNPLNRREQLQTAIPVPLKIVCIYKIINYSAYDVDSFLKTINEYKDLLWDIHIENVRWGDGGTEHYKLRGFNDLERLFDMVGIKYKLITDYDRFENHKHIEMNINEEIIDEFTTRLKKRPKIVLYEYQQKCVNIFKNKLNDEYFQGIYCLATGLGKTIISIHVCIEHLKKYPTENILWITCRNDIVDSQKTMFEKFNGTNIIFKLCHHAEFNSSKLKKNRGKVFVVLRQSLVNKVLPENTIHGLIYDESHDASKLICKNEDTDLTQRTYNFLFDLKEKQPLRYRIGLSATPLTDDIKQNIGVIKLYGEENKINYLYKKTLIEAVEDKYVSEPVISFCSSEYSLKELYKVFEGDKYEEKIQQNKKIIKKSVRNTINKIKKIFESNKLIYKKGIVWFPSVNMVKYFHKKMLKHWKTNIKISYSVSGMTDDNFIKSVDNHIMLACQKFVMGFDAVNLEVGINLEFEESGYIVVQKLGRITRKKENQSYAYFYQFCESTDNEEVSIIDTLVKICLNIGINTDNFDKYFKNLKNGNTPNANIMNNDNGCLMLDIKDFNITNMKFKNIKNKVFTKIKEMREMTFNHLLNNGYITYENIQKIILKEKPHSKEDYFKLCDKINDLPKDPKEVFKNKFISWTDYLGIDRNYYNFNECLRKIKKYGEPKKKIFEIANLAKYLHDLDGHFPPPDLWGDYYGVENTSTLINAFNNDD